MIPVDRAACAAALSTATPEQIGGTRGTRHFGRVVRVEETVVTIESRPLKWRGAPRYWWKRFANGQPRHLRRKGLSRRVHRALRKAGQL